VEPRPPKAHTLLECPVCRFDTGASGTTFIEAKRLLAVMDGKISGGQKALVCVDCLSRGKVTLI
jgi:hypothetical protein